MLKRILLVITAGLLIAADAKDDAIIKEMLKLKGTWQIVAIVSPDGVSEPEDRLKTLTMTFAGEKLTNSDGTRQRDLTCKIDPSKTPKEIDMIMTKDKVTKTVRGIYDLDGDNLKMCICEKGAARPKEFKVDKETGTGLVTLKREKK